MIRLTDCAVPQIAASAPSADVVCAIANLNQLIPNKGKAGVLSLKVKKTGAATNDKITVTRVLFRSTTNPEMVYQVYKGAGIDLDDLNDMLSSAANAGGPAVSIMKFDVEHGLEVVITCSNSDGSNAYDGRLLFKLTNNVPGGGILNSPQDVMQDPLTSLAPPAGTPLRRGFWLPGVGSVTSVGGRSLKDDEHPPF